MHIRDYVEHLKAKPEHTRRRIALGTSVGLTAIVFVGWLAAMGASGTLALSAPVSAEQQQELSAAKDQGASGFSNLLGAAAAFKSATGDDAGVTVVDGKSSSTLDTKADPNEGKTVIPF